MLMLEAAKESKSINLMFHKWEDGEWEKSWRVNLSVFLHLISCAANFCQEKILLCGKTRIQLNYLTCWCLSSELEFVFLRFIVTSSITIRQLISTWIWFSPSAQEWEKPQEGMREDSWFQQKRHKNVIRCSVSWRWN